jgi:hypothetical protein
MLRAELTRVAGTDTRFIVTNLSGGRAKHLYEGLIRELEAEIDDLLREKEEVEKWATAGSA